MGKKRRNHSASFKAKVALCALREQKTLSQIASEHSLHANQICDWKKTLVEKSAQLFETGSSKSPPQYEGLSDAEKSPLLEEIGRLQLENMFLKKKLKQFTVS